MSFTRRILLAAASGTLALSVLDMRVVAAERGDTRRPDDSRYSVIYERSIFLRDRRSRQFDTGPRTESVTRQSLSLTGTSLAYHDEFGGAVYTAFVEDGRSGGTQWLNVGDAIAGGTVKDIGIEYVDFEFGGVTRRITVGMNFEGLQNRGGSGSYAGGTGGERFAGEDRRGGDVPGEERRMGGGRRDDRGLEGGPLAAQPSGATTTTPPATGSGTAAATPSVSGADMEAQMRARRQALVGGGGRR